jgi:hypothetical protein
MIKAEKDVKEKNVTGRAPETRPIEADIIIYNIVLQ